MTGENWNEVLYNAVETTGYWVALPYFIFLVVVCQFLVIIGTFCLMVAVIPVALQVLNIFVAIVML